MGQERSSIHSDLSAHVRETYIYKCKINLNRDYTLATRRDSKEKEARLKLNPLLFFSDREVKKRTGRKLNRGADQG